MGGNTGGTPAGRATPGTDAGGVNGARAKGGGRTPAGCETGGVGLDIVGGPAGVGARAVRIGVGSACGCIDVASTACASTATGVSDGVGAAIGAGSATTGIGGVGMAGGRCVSITSGARTGVGLASTCGISNSSSIDVPAPIVMTPPQTEQRARTPADETFDGSTRNIDRHSGHVTFTSPPVCSRTRVSSLRLAYQLVGNPYDDRSRTQNQEASLHSSSSQSPAR